MIKLVAFDWNGTLISDAQACVEGVNQVLKYLKVQPTTLTRFRQVFDVPVSKSYLAHGVDKKTLATRSLEIAEVFHGYYEKRSIKVRTRQNTRKLLTYLKENNIERIIFSNHTHVGITNQLKRLKLEHFFSKVIANSELDSALKARGKKEKLEDYISSRKLKHRDVLIIGDTKEEVEIAKELGTISIVITHGHSSTPRLRATKPDYLISDLGQVINIVKKLNLL